MVGGETFHRFDVLQLGNLWVLKFSRGFLGVTILARKVFRRLSRKEGTLGARSGPVDYQL